MDFITPSVPFAERRNTNMVEIQAVKSIIENKLNQQILNNNVALSSVGVDSLVMVEIVVELEKNFLIEFSENFLNSLLNLTILDIVNEINSYNNS